MRSSALFLYVLSGLTQQSGRIVAFFQFYGLPCWLRWHLRRPRLPKCKGSWHGVAVTEGLRGEMLRTHMKLSTVAPDGKIS